MPTDAPVIGLLFGTQRNLDISICDATDAVYDVQGSSVTLKFPEIERVKDLTVGVYPQYELLGWYTSGSEILPEHLKIHQSFTALNEAPLFLLMNNNPSHEAKQLPVSIYEAEMHTVDDVPTQIFVDMPFKLVTAVAERVAVDQVTKLSSTGGQSSLELQNQSMTTALGTFQSKLQELTQVLQAMKDGRIPVDQDLLRRVSKISRQLPQPDSPHTHTSIGAPGASRTLENDLNECLMTSYLSVLTHNANALADISDMYTLTFAEKYSRTRF